MLVAAEAKAYGLGGIQAHSSITGIYRQTIYCGLKDLAAGKTSERVRKPGGCRKKLSLKNLKLSSVKILGTGLLLVHYQKPGGSLCY